MSRKKTWPKVAIIVLNWNGWRDTIECLESLQRLTYPNYQIIVVDNGSTDDSIEKIKAWARGEIPVESQFVDYESTTKPVKWVDYDREIAKAGGIPKEETELEQFPSNRRLVLIQTGENLGFAAGNNIAIEYALKREYPYICLLNNDTVVKLDFLEKLIETLESCPYLMAVGPKILYKDDPTRIWYAGARLRLCLANAVHLGLNKIDGDQWIGVRLTDHVSGCCFVARKCLFKTVGLLDEDFFFGHEDTALSCVAKRQGVLLGVDLDAKIYHKFGGTLERENPVYIYYHNKNRLLILKKHGSLLERILGFFFYVLTRLIKFPILLSKGRGGAVRAELQAVRDFLLGRYGDHDRKRANCHD